MKSRPFVQSPKMCHQNTQLLDPASFGLITLSKPRAKINKARKENAVYQQTQNTCPCKNHDPKI